MSHGVSNKTTHLLTRKSLLSQSKHRHTYLSTIKYITVKGANSFWFDCESIGCLLLLLLHFPGIIFLKDYYYYYYYFYASGNFHALSNLINVLFKFLVYYFSCVSDYRRWVGLGWVRLGMLLYITFAMTSSSFYILFFGQMHPSFFSLSPKIYMSSFELIFISLLI